MKRKSNPISMFVMIAVIGLVVSFLNGDFQIGSYFEGLEVTDPEVLLEYLSLGMGFLAISSIFIYLIVRAARGKETSWGKEAAGEKEVTREKETSWLEQVLRDKQEDDRQDPRF